MCSGCSSTGSSARTSQTTLMKKNDALELKILITQRFQTKKAEFGRDDTVKEKEFYVLPSKLFVNVAKNARHDSDLNETLATAFNNIKNPVKGTENEDDLRRLFADINVNSAKLGNTVKNRNHKLTKLFETIGELRFGDYADNSIDRASGDIYEFLKTTAKKFSTHLPLAKILNTLQSLLIANLLQKMTTISSSHAMLKVKIYVR